LTRGIARVRWRLTIGLAALLATVVLTFPAGQLGRQLGEIWPNSLSQVADVIWPLGPDFVADTIWPLLPFVNDVTGQALQ
jgi:hypothetical protein